MSTPPVHPHEVRVPPATGAESSDARSKEIRAHLERILASATFGAAKNQQRLLRFLVEALISGDAPHIKEYSLGVEVFGRGADFDPRLDPIVRVEASRLRNRLHKYYETEGRGSQLIIDLPRGGYVPAIRELSVEQPATAAAASTAAPLERSAAPAERWRRYAWTAGMASVILCAAAAVWLIQRPGETAAFQKFTRLTRDEGRCTAPSLSPDGKRIAYARLQGESWDIWVRDIRGVAVRNITAGSNSVNLEPAFSPDGKSIAFFSTRGGGGIYVVSAAGGPARRLSGFGFHPAWSPDGKRIAVSTSSFLEPSEFDASRRSRIFVIDAASGAAHAVTDPSIDALQPAWSPNGRRIAFWGANPNGDFHLWTIAVDSPGTESRPVAVTSGHGTNWNPAWAPNGRYLYFSSDRAGTMNLWRVRIDESTGDVRGVPEPLTTPSSNSGWIAFSGDGRRLAYTRRLTYSRLYRQDFDPERGVVVGAAKELTSGERRIREPEISPNGMWVAARVQDPQSDLVVLRPDGSGLVRLTNDGYADRVPRWSPDGHWIVFQSNRGGKLAYWVVRPDGGGLRELPADGTVHTAWTPDGALVAFPRDGKPYTLEPAGRAVSPAALAVPGLLPLAWSHDARYVAGWLASGEPGREPLAVYSFANRSYWNVASHGNDPAWLKNGHGFLYGEWNAIHFADVRDNTTHLVVSGKGREIHPKFALSRDERYILYVAMEDEEDIWIAER